MMNKKYLMRGFAALALVAGFSSCVKDVDGTSQKEIDDRSKENAEMQLGISIPDGQTWDMASQVEANVTVNGDYGAKYTVSIYENNPFINNTAVVLGKAETVSGGTASTSFTCPDATKSVFVAIKDEKGYSYVKPAAVVDGKIETTFGGEAAAGARSMRAANRSAADDFVVNVRTMPNLSTYIDDAVAINDENNTTDPANTVHHYLIPEGTTWSKNIPLIQSGSGISVYVQGTLNINAEQRVNGGCVFIVGPKGKVNIANGQKLVTNANNEAGTVGSFYVYPGGEVKGDRLEFANGTGSYNYNGGTIDVTTINNNGGTLYNAGIIEADYMLGGAGLSIYENAGKVHIGEAPKGSSTANTRIHNNCWWECDGTQACRNIQQGAGAYIKASNLDMSSSQDGTSDVAYIWAKGNSLIAISGNVSLNGVDIVGPTSSDYAYIQFGKMTYVNHTGGTNSNYGVDKVTLGAIQNNVRISVDTPEVDNNVYTFTPYEKLINLLNGTFMYATEERDQEWGQWHTNTPGEQIGNGNAVLVAKGQVNDVKTESECSPGIDIVPPTPIYEELKVYTYAFEDQTVGTDYDMNDVVLKVSYKVKSTNAETGEVEYDKTKLVATLVAAGATYNIKVKIGNTYLFNEQEIHEALGVNPGVMVNTGNGKAQTATPVSSEITTPTGLADEDGNIDFTQLPVTIEVTSTGKNYSYPNTDPYPHAVMIPVDWRWPLERIIVTEAYPGTSNADKVTIDGVDYPVNSFDAWAATPAADRTPAMNGWYNNPNTGLTMTNTSAATNN
ncbi:DUF4842 domain-containing protein [Prevotella sp. tf2-5]|uniref:DUF4842 domain-containing protein n=1 Tax=Prevotella sp. tf2-5 TaxID=1761889 RepID=UPI000B822877|nr:DUF4842 domain-containing protein [Prevotella sp. tf2-5]